jgi:hypothetical protein
LDEFWDEEGGAGSEDMLGSEQMMAGLEQCGIDLNKIMTATMMITTSSQSTGDFFDFFSMLAEEGEQDCSAEQETQYEEAATSFVACAGEKYGVTTRCSDMFRELSICSLCIPFSYFKFF